MATKRIIRGIRSQRSVRYVLVGSKTRNVPAGFHVCRTADLATCLKDVSRNTVFISLCRSATDELLRESLEHGRSGSLGALLTFEPPRPESVPSLAGVFDRVIGAIAGYRWLPIDELLTVLSGKDAANRFIGGAADLEGGTLALVRGNLMTIVAPFSHFKESGVGTRPDFARLSFADYGLTMALGAYEASADGILYEFDEGYRQTLNKRRRESERTFGASLRRLRLQRRLKQSDFTPLTSKTIARIERNEVGKPHGKTLATIAERLGVSADQIESY